MQIAGWKMRYSWSVLVLLALALVWVLSTPHIATAEIYANSAHGDTSCGVHRSGAGCPKGDCAHCHDTFNSSICGVNDRMLFVSDNPTSQTDNFCYQCHKGTGSVQVGGITNNEYSATFGGGTVMFDCIYDALNPASTVDFPFPSFHGLASVQGYARGRTWGSWMTADTNACLVCHYPHLSQKNSPVEINAHGGVNTVVRRGNDVNDDPGDLWGDEPAAVSGRNEMMSDCASGYVYQAPLRGDSGYEPGPAGSTIQDGSNLPNFVDACAQTCHRNDIDSVNGPIAVNWKETTSSEWPGTPSKHGMAAADNAPGDWGWLKPPYIETLRGSYVLSCTDCHEPHGSPNATNLRRTVNGVTIPPVTFPDPRPQTYEDVEIGDSTGAEGWVYPDGGFWYHWCSACHDLTYNYQTGEGHVVIYEYARCGDYVGCHLFHTPGNLGPGGDHGYWF